MLAPYQLFQNMAMWAILVFAIGTAISSFIWSKYSLKAAKAKEQKQNDLINKYQLLQKIAMWAILIFAIGTAISSFTWRQSGLKIEEIKKQAENKNLDRPNITVINQSESEKKEINNIIPKNKREEVKIIKAKSEDDKTPAKIINDSVNKYKEKDLYVTLVDVKEKPLKDTPISMNSFKYRTDSLGKFTIKASDKEFLIKEGWFNSVPATLNIDGKNIDFHIELNSSRTYQIKE